MGSDLTARIKHLMFYPVKSAAGIVLEEAKVTDRGLHAHRIFDHEYMIVHAERENGVHAFLTQREDPALAHIKPIINGGLILTWDYQNGIAVRNKQGVELPVRVWDDRPLAVDQGDYIAQWLSHYLQREVRLVRAAGNFQRQARQNYLENTNGLGFQDAYPIHWFPIESVNELSERAGQTIPWQSFRPQIVVEGMPAQHEHLVYEGTLNSIPFVQPKPCDRCKVTLIDQNTAKQRDKEPLRTLNQYKVWYNNEGQRTVIFGENMLPRAEGRVRTGDVLTVVSERNPPLVYGTGKSQKTTG